MSPVALATDQMMVLLSSLACPFHLLGRFLTKFSGDVLNGSANRTDLSSTTTENVRVANLCRSVVIRSLSCECGCTYSAHKSSCVVSRDSHYCSRNNCVCHNLVCTLPQKSVLIPRKVVQKLSLGHVTWKAMRRNAWSGTANWLTTNVEQLYKVSTPCLDDNHVMNKNSWKR